VGLIDSFNLNKNFKNKISFYQKEEFFPLEVNPLQAFDFIHDFNVQMKYLNDASNNENDDDKIKFKFLNNSGNFNFLKSISFINRDTIDHSMNYLDLKDNISIYDKSISNSLIRLLHDVPYFRWYGMCISRFLFIVIYFLIYIRGY